MATESTQEHGKTDMQRNPKQVVTPAKAGVQAVDISGFRHDCLKGVEEVNRFHISMFFRGFRGH